MLQHLYKGVVGAICGEKNYNFMQDTKMRMRRTKETQIHNLGRYYTYINMFNIHLMLWYCSFHKSLLLAIMYHTIN